MVSVQEIYFDIGFDRIQNNEMRIEMLFFYFKPGVHFLFDFDLYLDIEFDLDLNLDYRS